MPRKYGIEFIYVFPFIALPVGIYIILFLTKDTKIAFLYSFLYSMIIISFIIIYWFFTIKLPRIIREKGNIVDAVVIKVKNSNVGGKYFYRLQRVTYEVTTLEGKKVRKKEKVIDGGYAKNQHIKVFLYKNHISLGLLHTELYRNYK